MPHLTCEDCGNSFFQSIGRPAKRCPDCRPAGSLKYGTEHQRLREATVFAAYGTPCVRCGKEMKPGQKLNLDHSDDGTVYLGYSHQRCNSQAGAAKRWGKAKVSNRNPPSRWW
jgi:DNA-directed RNA polymerase subunit RPC12/RpoP